MDQGGSRVAAGPGTYIPRLVDQRLSDLFADLPALLITGPRAIGKTTTVLHHATTVIRLDRPAEAAAFRADPDVALRAQQEPVLLDEWQAVPEVLGAVKRAVDDDPRPRRFLLTGSVRADLDQETWPGTGRVVRLRMYGITQRELAQRPTGPLFLDRLARADIRQFQLPPAVPDLRDYIDHALRSGFPEVLLRLSGAARQAWLDGYLDQLLTRDAEGFLRIRDPARLRRYFEALALNTAGLAEQQTLYSAAGIDRHTALAYDQLLINLFVLELLPAWTTNRLSRLIKTPKRYLVDPALVGVALRLETAAILRDGDLLGRILDTFVMAQIRPEVEVSTLRPRLYHLRDMGGRREIDVVGEIGNGVVGVEIKATAAPSAADGAHLAYLRDQLAERFLAGAVLHTGPASFALSDRVYALPICTLWG